jgi:hypothetical protein
VTGCGIPGAMRKSCCSIESCRRGGAGAGQLSAIRRTVVVPTLKPEAMNVAEPPLRVAEPIVGVPSRNVIIPAAFAGSDAARTYPLSRFSCARLKFVPVPASFSAISPSYIAAS